jgi:hypothetical protein
MTGMRLGRGDHSSCGSGPRFLDVEEDEGQRVVPKNGIHVIEGTLSEGLGEAADDINREGWGLRGVRSEEWDMVDPTVDLPLTLLRFIKKPP